MILKIYNCLAGLSWWIKHFSEVKSTEWFLLVIRFRRWRASRAAQSYRISSPQNANFASSHHLILQSFGLHRIMTDLKKRGGWGSPNQLFYIYTFQKKIRIEVWKILLRSFLDKILKLRLVNILKFKFSRDSDVWLRFWSWCLIEILKIVLNKIFSWTCDMT